MNLNFTLTVSFLANSNNLEPITILAELYLLDGLQEEKQKKKIIKFKRDAERKEGKEESRNRE